MARIVIILMMILMVISCKINNQDDPLAVAKVGDKILSKSELKEIIPPNASKNDSLFIADNYIQQWITKQLIINEAELNLTEEQKDVSKMVENYRNALLIHIYKSHFVHQKLDSTISDTEINKYYRKYPNNFILDVNLVKGVFVKIKKPFPEKRKIKKWLKSNKKEDADALEDFCFQRATNYDTFDGEWVAAQLLLDKIPLKIDDRILFLKKNKFIETEDKDYFYFLRIDDLLLKGSTAPVDYVKRNIKKIILNKRKLQLENRLENDIYKDAKAKHKFKIYSNQ